MIYPDCFKALRFSYDPKQREEFRRGKLGPKWKAEHPSIFDDDDLRLYRNQCRRGYHFCEWYAAIKLFELTGYFSMAKYGAKCHKFKRPLLKSIVPSKLYDYIVDDWSGMPDLLAYAPDRSDYFFCEVKGPRDSFHGRQNECAKELSRISRKPVGLLFLDEKWTESQPGPNTERDNANRATLIKLASRFPHSR